MKQIWKENEISVCWMMRLVRCFISVCCPIDRSCQRLDVPAITHDHGSDITKGVGLSGVHSFLCVDHELDLTVQDGILSPHFLLSSTKPRISFLCSETARTCIANFGMSRLFVLVVFIIISITMILRFVALCLGVCSLHCGHTRVSRWSCHPCSSLLDGSLNRRCYPPCFKTNPTL